MRAKQRRQNFESAGRKRMEEKLQLLSDAVRMTTESIVIVDLNGVILDINEAGLRMIGLDDRADLVGKDYLVLIDPEDRQNVMENMAKVLVEGSLKSGEYHSLRKDGSKMLIEAGGSLIRDEKGEPKAIVVVTRDITERKLMEDKLRLLSDAVSMTTESITIVDLNGIILDVNEAGLRMHGLGNNKADFVGKNPFDIIVPEERQKAMEDMAKVLAEGSLKTVAYHILKKDGSKALIETSISPIRDEKGEPKCIVAVARDITERRRMEEALRESEERFRRLVDEAPDIIFRWSVEKGLEYISPAITPITGYTPEEMMSAPFFGLQLAGHFDKRVGEDYERIVREGTSEFIRELSVLRKDGRQAHLDMKTHTVKDDKGRIIAFEGIMRDITDQKLAEEALKRSEQDYKDLFDNVLDGLLVLDAETMTFVLANEAAARISGFDSPKDVIGTKPLAHIQAEEREKAAKIIEEEVFGQDFHRSSEYQTHTKDGREVWINSVSRRIEYQGKMAALISIQDITERKRMEEALRESEERFRAIVESAPFGYYRVGKDGLWQYVNPTWQKMHGFSFEEVIGKPFEITQTEGDVEQARELVRRVLAGESIKGEISRLRKDGGIEYHSFNIQPVRHGNEIVAIEGFINDITGRKKMEEALRESEERFRRLVDHAPDIIFRWSVKKGLEYISPAVTAITGYTPEEAMAERSIGLRLTGQFDKRVVEDYERVVKEGIAEHIRELTLLRKDGKQAHLDMRTNAIKDDKGRVIAFEGILRDITEQKLAEAALRQSERNYRVLFESETDGMMVIDAETLKIVLVNQSTAEMFGLNSPEEAIGVDVFEVIHPEERDDAIKLLRDDVFEKDMHKTNEARCITKDGRVIWTNVVGARTVYQGRAAYLAAIRDITERKKAEEALRLSEERYRLVVDNANEVILVAQDGMLKFFNSRAPAALGYSKEELASRPFIEFVHPDDRKVIAGRYMARLRGEGMPSVYSFRVVDRAGNVRWVEINAVVLNWEGRPATLNFLTDVTERKRAEEEKQRMEEQLRLAGRLAAVGELAAGVAHELNNPLTAIQGFAQLLTARDDLDEATKKDLDIVYREAQRAGKITGNLLSFARRREPEKHLISINEVVETTLELRAHQMKVNNIEVVADFAADLPQTMADFFQMQQVFVNIINNAEQAMLEAHGRGRLVVRTQTAGDMIRISFADNGPGISEENLKRIFDPFFTTKEVGKGTGLGLSICYGIVEAHGGRIYARSKLGEGATFVVEIPIVPEGQ